MHDIDYKYSAFSRDVMGSDVNTQRSIRNEDDWEHTGYVMGVVGAAILTLSIDRLKNKDRPVKKAVSKFRRTMGILAGTSALVGGQILHERGDDDDLVLFIGPSPEFRLQYLDVRNNPREHLGFFLGAAGASFITFSVK